MKKLKTCLLILPLLFCITGCSKIKSLFFGVHIYDFITGGADVAITSWDYSNDDIIVETEEYGYIYLTEGTFFLITDVDHCPLCD